MRYIIFLPFILICFNACFISGKDCFKDHLFTIDFNISPAQDTFHVGDTIWISSTIPEELLDEENQKLTNVSDINFPILFNANQIDTSDFAPAEHYFDYLIEEGELFFQNISTWVTIDLMYEQIGKQQKIRFGIIPQRAANIQLSFYSLTEELEAIHPSNCVGKTLLHYNVNGGDAEANHYYFIEESNNPWIKITKDAYEIEGVYSFAVME